MAYKLITNSSILFLFLIFIVSFQSSNAAYNVVNYGAKPDGRTDSTQGFQKAWKLACSSAKPSTIYVPKGYFLISPVTFSGPCKNKIIFQFQSGATIVAPSDYRALGNSGYWILFYKVSRVSVYGGTLDARGAGFWACRSSGKSCPTGARSISFVSSNNIVMDGIKTINSQIMHVALDTCNNVVIRNMKIIAPGGSPNTDGIHLQSSTGVTISSSSITTGDDCISIGPGNKNIWIERIACGPGHGISIGSLGNSVNEAGVQNVTVTSTVFTGTQNGVRIKSWARPSNGFARNIVFRNIVMKNVDNPIIIDQTYCPDNHCPHQSSGVKISKVTYTNISGTSRTQVAINLNCSPSNPCRGIKLQNIKLTSAIKKAATSYCSNVNGKSSGLVIPRSCVTNLNYILVCV